MAVDADLFREGLPTYLTRFIGRGQECQALASLLREQNLVTVCGIGGAGKTRLANEVAKRFRAGRGAAPSVVEVYWVPLVGVTTPREVGPAIAAGLGLPGAVARRGLDRIAAALGSRRILLVLDNCEHVASECRRLVAQLLPTCPRLTILTTSRVPLDISSEVVYAIPPLGELTDPTSQSTNDSTALFIDRASAVAPTYAVTDLNAGTLAEICRMLHGLPLAIELVASWIRVLSADDLLTHLRVAHQPLESHAALVEERHRSIQAVLESSWKWLRQTERSVLAALGVFVGGFTGEAAEAVAGADVASLARLAELSLIQRLPNPSGGSRYQVHELVRTYALSRLDRAEDVRDKHMSYFLDLVESLNPTWNTPIEPLWSHPVGLDLANIDDATGWALERRDAERAQRLAVGLDRFWAFCFPSNAHRAARLKAALALPGPLDSPAAVRARAVALHLAGLRVVSTDPDQSRSHYREAEPLFAQVGDAAGVAACVRDCGNARLLQGDAAGCRQDALASLPLAQAGGDRQGAAWAWETAGAAALVQEDWAAATDFLRQAAEDFAERSAPMGACRAQIQLAVAHWMSGRLLDAIEASQQALDYERSYRLAAEWADIIDVTAQLCAERHRWTTAAQLHGAAAGWRTAFESISWYPVVGRFIRTDRARRQLGESGWTTAYKEGQRLDTDRASELAESALTALRNELDLSSTGLSDREIEVIRLVGDGMGDADIAKHLVVSPRTVHAHLRSIYRKLGVTSRTAAVRAAGLLPAP